jgi:flagellar export protein FliJ
VSKFKFRAQAALDLRKREDDDARRALARAETDLRAAQRILGEVEERARDARTRCAAAMQQGGSPAELQWYRSWIVRLDRDRGAAARAVADREAALVKATDARARTRQRVESLERFKEKATHAFEQRVLADEQKFIDALATMRYVSRQK